MLNLFKRLSRRWTAYRAAPYALAIAPTTGAHAAIGMRAAQIFA